MPKILKIKQDNKGGFSIHTHAEKVVPQEVNTKRLWRNIIVFVVATLGYTLLFFYLTVFFKQLIPFWIFVGVVLSLLAGLFLLFYTIYQSDETSNYRVLTLDSEKKQLIIKGIASIQEEVLAIHLYQLEKFELQKKLLDRELMDKLQIQYGNSVSDQIKRYQLELCLLTRNSDSNRIVLFHSIAFSQQDPLLDKEMEEWQQLTKHLNDFILE